MGFLTWHQCKVRQKTSGSYKTRALLPHEWGMHHEEKLSDSGASAVTWLTDPGSGAVANACGRDAVTAPASRLLNTWVGLGPSVLS